MRVIGVDWSGAAKGASSKIWLAEVRHGRLVRLESGRDRASLVAHLIDDLAGDSGAVVGLDFAFSFPQWFVRRLGAATADGLWSVVSDRGEEWLRECPDPFWGRPGRRKPDLEAHLRRTEQSASDVIGSNPKSVFQIAGAGAVGTGSIRGMPHLARLRDAGFCIWPFHEGGGPVVIEIYPRLLTGRVSKSDALAREAYLAEGLPEIDDALRPVAASSEDAFDAAVSAVILGRHSEELSRLRATKDPVERVEGTIWWPRVARPPDVPAVTPTSRVVGCPFCKIEAGEILMESRHAIAFRDGFPVNRGHTLVAPRRHYEALFDLSPELLEDVWRLVGRVRSSLATELRPNGFNIGVNDGRAAGQTVGHAHVHVIPRFDGDVPDPRGGLRWVVPQRADYWTR